MENSKIKKKTYADTFLYSAEGNYEKNLFKFLMEAKVVDKNDKSFENIAYDVKRRQLTTVLSRVLMNDNVVLLKHPSPLPRSFKVFAAADIKNGSKMHKVYIDVSDIISEQDGGYSCRIQSIDILVAYLVSALQIMIYENEPERLLNNATILESSTKCFASLFTYIIDYLRVGGVPNIREKVLYLSSMYYQVGILRKEPTDSVTRRAINISKLTSRDIEILDMQIEKDSFDNIDKFIKTVAKIIRADNLKLDNFMDKWMMMFGSGTQFATELYPAFSSMLTNAYAGAYINGQKTIEKIAGKDMVTYSNTLLSIGGECL